MEQGDGGEGEDRVEPGDRTGGVEESDESYDEVDIDEHGDDALELGLRALDEGHHDDSEDKEQEQGAVVLMGGEERIHTLNLRATGPDSSTGTLWA